MIDRPGVRALHRQGYQLRLAEHRSDDFRRATAEARIANWMSRLADLGFYLRPEFARGRSLLKISTSIVDGQAGEVQVHVSLAFDPTRVTFSRMGDDYHASIDLAVALDDVDGAVLGERSERVELNLSGRDFERTKREWLAVTVSVTAQRHPARVRAVVYDYDSDRTASASSRIERR